MKKIILIIAVLFFNLTAIAQQKDAASTARNQRQTDFLPISENGNSSSAEPGVSPAARDFNNQGVDKTLKEGDFKAATELFRKAIAADSSCLKCRYNLGMSLINLEKFDESIQTFNELLKLKNDYAAAFSGLGEACTKKGLFQESAAAYRKAAQITPNDAVVLSNLGNALYQIKNFDESLVNLNKAVKLNSELAGAHSNRGTTLFALGRTKEAIESLRRALELDPATPEAHNNLGVALDSLGRKKEAQAHYLEAIRLRPNWKMALYNLSLNYYESGNQTAARQYLRQLEEVDASMAREVSKVISAKFVLNATGVK